MSGDLVFVGYRSGLSKKNEKYFILNFITFPCVNKKGDCAYSRNVDIFVDVDKYNSFIKENELLSVNTIPCEIYGDKVRYYL